MGHRRCEVCGTKEGWHTVNKLLFSMFPLDQNRCREWLKAVGNEELVYLPIEKLHEQRYVCANHFDKNDFNKNGNRLKRHAIPTLNLWALPLTDEQLAEFPQHIYQRSESKDDGTIQDDSQDVQENIEITLEAPIQLAQDNSQLDPELLSAQGDTTDEQPIYGENIHHTLAKRWIPLLKKGLAKNMKEKVLKEYQIPKNCKLLRAPTLNPEIKAAVSETIINQDKNLQLKQDQLGLGISALNKAITQLLQGDDKIQAIKILSDSSMILTDLHYRETQMRKKLITPCLDKSFTPLIKGHKRDETLFGEQLSETVRASKSIERQRSPTAGPLTARTLFSGNGTGSPCNVSVSRAGRGGYARAVTANRRQPKSTRPRASPTQGKHRAQTRH